MHGLTGGGWKRGNLRHRASPLPSQHMPLIATVDTVRRLSPPAPMNVACVAVFR
jgi:hypothetical protein